MPGLVDLTLPLADGMRGVGLEPAKTLARDGWNATTLSLYSHAGTHMDAQTHFGAGPGTIDRTPLASCMGPAHVLDLPGLEPRALLTVASLGDLPDRFHPGDSLLLRTGWSAFLHDATLYRDGLPRIAEDLARWCVDRKVKILGVEPPSIADVNHLPEVTRIHEILLAGGVTIVEGLCHLDRLRSARVFFFALPLPVRDGDGCPCRAFALDDPAALADLARHFLS
ncbi:MAG: cyclase family protein [Puniceicoccaceae bacterium]|nr:MAG: cyclase family protein [Puniceicoccaceae bacterium]